MGIRIKKTKAEDFDEEPCPTCGHRIKVYRRTLTRGCALVVGVLAQQERGEFVHLPRLIADKLPQFAGQGGYLLTPKFWDMIEEEGTVRQDGGRSGYWRITDDGRTWVRGGTRVPRAAFVANNRLIGFDDTTRVTFKDALGEGFDLQEIL